MSTIYAFDGLKTKHNVWRGKSCMKKFWKSLEEHEMKIINFEKKKIISVTEKVLESYENYHI